MLDPEPLAALPEAYVGRACSTGFTVGGHSPESPCGVMCSPGALAERGAWVDAARELVGELQSTLAQGVTNIGLGTRVQILSNVVEDVHTRASIEDVATAVQELRCIREDANASLVAPPPPPSIEPPEPGGDGGFTWPSLPSLPKLPTFTWPSFGIPEWMWWAAGGVLVVLIASKREPRRRQEEAA